jgi:hypothetical protein
MQHRHVSQVADTAEETSGTPPHRVDNIASLSTIEADDNQQTGAAAGATNLPRCLCCGLLHWFLLCLYCIQLCLLAIQVVKLSCCTDVTSTECAAACHITQLRAVVPALPAAGYTAAFNADNASRLLLIVLLVQLSHAQLLHAQMRLCHPAHPVACCCDCPACCCLCCIVSCWLRCCLALLLAMLLVKLARSTSAVRTYAPLLTQLRAAVTALTAASGVAGEAVALHSCYNCATNAQNCLFHPAHPVACCCDCLGVRTLPQQPQRDIAAAAAAAAAFTG